MLRPACRCAPTQGDTGRRQIMFPRRPCAVTLLRHVAVQRPLTSLIPSTATAHGIAAANTYAPDVATHVATVPEPEGLQATSYSLKSKKYISLVNKLRANNAQYSLALPSLVVCGNQSAGKSTVLERVTGVKLPRSSGTCTKCPTAVRLSTEAPLSGITSWQCEIKLRREYDEDGERLPDTKEETFVTLDEQDKHLLHLYISSAQKALLNPSTPASNYLPKARLAAARVVDPAVASATSQDSTQDILGTSEGEQEVDALTFSLNVVVLEIWGAEADLTLIDLPGFIHSSKGSGMDVELVQQLVWQYIRGERTIIVETISAKDDLQNQQILGLMQLKLRVSNLIPIAVFDLHLKG